MRPSVHPDPSFDRAQGTVSYTVTVEPGPVYTMGKLTIENVSDDLRAMMLAEWKMPAGAVFNESAVRNFFAIGDANSKLARVFATVNCKYIVQLNDLVRTVDVVLRLEKKN
jgi:outer membrane protein assembly factor BamA